LPDLRKKKKKMRVRRRKKDEKKIKTVATIHQTAGERTNIGFSGEPA